MLEKHFTVYAIDRRGRGGSGDAPDYAMEREFEDVAAVVDAIGGEVNLLGHSFGALCALEAALLTDRVRKLVAYEPPPAPVPDGLIDELQDLIDAGDREGAIVTFVRELVKMPPHELERWRTSPVFPARVAAAHTLPRELRALEDEYRVEYERFRHLEIPVLLLLGGDSPPFNRENIDAWHSVLPDSRVVVLHGQQHIAMDTNPDVFAKEVTDFLTAPD
jgi:pimeloyl-ACP methyl ester carboxylesterase